MASVRELLQAHGLDPVTAQWLSHLVVDWHLLADLSFSDLVLWVPAPMDADIYDAVAQIRPATGPTALEDDVVGDQLAYEPDSGVAEAWMSGEPVETGENKLQAGIPVDVVAIPVRRPAGFQWDADLPPEVGEALDELIPAEPAEAPGHEPEVCDLDEFDDEEFDDEVDERLVAVVERHTNQMTVRAPSTLEDNYLEIAEILTGMLQRGEFPIPGEPIDPTQSLRVGDGLIRLDAAGQVVYATPNATTGYRRLGLTRDLLDQDLASVVEQLVTEEPEVEIREFLHSEITREIDIVAEQVVLRLRVLPLRDADGPIPPIVLSKDISEIRRRERELVTKDATIREIHHRVKNNLQTVAALLRMQGRRIQSADAEAALGEAMSRVGAIAVVHEILSQTYDEAVEFDDVADRVLRMVADVSRASQSRVRVSRQGSFGRIPAQVATPLALVVTELCQNAIEHGLGDAAGTVLVKSQRDRRRLTVQVCDDGRGLPPNVDPTGNSLGLSIVRTLVSDLGGSFTLGPNPQGRGTMAMIEVPIPSSRRGG
ncbi:sensor histidine kinase [Naumannella halotolerans]|uniref:histidine kinase n=1 Tax=Naumannella halotolerans TaxID=993414 RepID=A0A4R7JAK4_9ACTN|nr:two-component sensor histidine kinase [Naumannella halotolerans]